MRLRNVFHAFALGVLIQTAATAQATLTDGGGLNRVGRNLWGVNLVATVDNVSPTPAPVFAPPAPLDLAAVELADEESYMDVYGILKEENSCSRFFGGPAQALEAFNDFARRLRKKPVGDSGVAIKMSGAYTIYRNNRTGASFRLFDEASINSNGPFVIRVKLLHALQMRVGSFPVPSKGARALTLLHELGHLVRGTDGRWLLPNDGGDRRLSQRNTAEVEARCFEQLMALRD